jgi:hypothetical protein
MAKRKAENKKAECEKQQAACSRWLDKALISAL